MVVRRGRLALQVKCSWLHLRLSLSLSFTSGVLEEAKFFGISKAIEPLEGLVRVSKSLSPVLLHPPALLSPLPPSPTQGDELSASGHFTRKEFLHFLAVTSSSASLRCQVGVACHQVPHSEARQPSTFHPPPFPLLTLASLSIPLPLPYQGLNLEGVDLSNLDLRNINFKCANLRQCNLSSSDLSNCNFERADLYKANLDVS